MSKDVPLNPEDATGPEGLPSTDATEAIPMVEPTAELPSVEDASNAADSGAPEWTRADEAELRSAPAYAASSTPIPPVPPAGSAGGGGGRVGAAWRHVWSSGWGKAAVIGVATLATLAVIAAIGLGAMAHGRDDRGRMGQDGWSMGHGEGQGQGKARGHGKGQGRGDSRGMGQGNGMGPNGMGPNGMGPNGMSPNGMGEDDSSDDQGMPGMRGPAGIGGSGLGALGEVLHGEAVVGGLNAKSVLFQVGQVTEFTAGKTLAVKSSDGFTATYVLTADTKGSAQGLTVGSTVRVLADKEGAKATRVQVMKVAAAS